MGHPYNAYTVSRRFVRKTSCQHDILSGWPDRLGRFVRTALDVLSGWIHVRRFVRKTFFQDMGPKSPKSQKSQKRQKSQKSKKKSKKKVKKVKKKSKKVKKVE